MAPLAVRVVYFGNSRTAFSNRLFGALTESSANLVAVVDAPAASLSTDQRPPQESHILDVVAGRGISYFRPGNVNDPEFVAECGRLGADLFIAVGYTSKLGEPLLSIPKVGAVNFHASLLPAYRGLHPVFWALYYGEKMSGITVHHLDAGLDTGAIVYQVPVRVLKRDTVAALYDRIIIRSLPLIGRLVRAAGRGDLPKRHQDRSSGSYFSKVSDEHYRIDWQQPASIIESRVWATPGKFYFETAGLRLHLLDADARAKSYPLEPGTLVRAEPFGVIVAAGSGSVRFNRVLIDEKSTLVTELQLQQGMLMGSH